MDRLNIVGMIISPRPSHSFGLDVVRHNLVVIREGLVADRTFAILRGDFSIQELSHLYRRPQFAISPGMVWIFNPLNAKLKSAFFPRLLPTTAEQRPVEWTIFIPTKFHANAPVSVFIELCSSARNVAPLWAA